MGVLRLLGDTARFFGIKNPLLLKEIFFAPPLYVRTSVDLDFAKRFDSYIDDNSAYSSLIKGLDEESISVVDSALNAIRQLRESSLVEKTSVFRECDLSVQNFVEKENVKAFKRGGYRLPKGTEYESSVFYFEHGIEEISGILERVSGRDILDCGGFVGDSSIVFSKKLNPRKIHVFEPVEKNYSKLLETIRLNNLGDKINPIKSGVGEVECDLKISYKGSASSLIGDNADDAEVIRITTIDRFISEYDSVIPALIKWDIEGFELESIKGGIETIKKHKPILIISIYHCGKDYFGIKPLLESLNIGYQFKIRKYNVFHPWHETVLIAY